ncbi:Fc.00g043870.m01.CDS01 [Cosmosporella sp. VM-42]
MSKPNETAIIIVGGSLVGLSTALFLSTLKVPVILLERHANSSLHPRAVGYTARTLEALRAVGVASKFPTPQWAGHRGRAPGGPPRRIIVESLAGKWQEEKHWTPKNADGAAKKPKSEEKKAEDYSPVVGIASAQDMVEPVLRMNAVERGADLRLGCKVTKWSQDDSGVNATYVDQEGDETTVKGRYLVACDGGRSPIREQLGIQRHGVGHLRLLRSILFRCPKIDHFLETGIGQFQIEGREDGFEAYMMSYGSGRWALMWNPTSEQQNTTMDETTQKESIRKGVGKEIELADEDIKLITTGEWDLSGLIADKFSSGRVFLAGDAAHQLPPNRGGYGANTGIADAHNIAWKLAAVVNGVSKPELLGTYDEERRAVALARHDQIFARDDYRRYVEEREWDGKHVEVFDDVCMEFGQLYRSGGILGADANLPLARRPDEWNGQPGTRAPHIPLRRGEETISSLDLFCKGWAVLSKNKAWSSLVAEASNATGVECSFVEIGGEIKETEARKFEESFGVDGTGAVLIRPDGYIAWRAISKPNEALGSLTAALGKVAYAVKIAV